MIEARPHTSRVPHWGWLLALSGVLVVLSIGIRFLLPVYWQCQTIAELRAAGISIESEGPKPEWLPKLTGESLDTVFAERVGISDWQAPGSITDRDLRQLNGMANLISLYLTGESITDVGLSHLTGSLHLRYLSLIGTQVTDAGLVHVAKLKYLTHLNLIRDQITDAGLIHLADLAYLRTLDLRDTGITDAGLVHLGRLTELRQLYLAETQVTDAGLGHWIELLGSKQSNLEFLDLSKLAITDAGLAHLVVLTNLQELWLDCTQVTSEGTAEFQAALPACKILGPAGAFLDDIQSTHLDR